MNDIVFALSWIAFFVTCGVCIGWNARKNYNNRRNEA